MYKYTHVCTKTIERLKMSGIYIEGHRSDKKKKCARSIY